MFAADDSDSNALIPSILDMERLCSMGIGEKVDAESGNWSVARYKRVYCLILTNHPMADFKEFGSFSDLVSFLKNS